MFCRVRTKENAVKSQKAQGMTLAEVLEIGVAEQYASYDWRFITEARWLATLYHSQLQL